MICDKGALDARGNVLQIVMLYVGRGLVLSERSKKMTPYKNLGGNSGIVGYEISEDAIVVVFASGTCRNYLYNHNRPGKATVDEMKRLAQQGHGLNAYITTIDKDNYARKW
jgi:hypothetical protein